LAELAGERDEGGRRLVVRNGHAQPREVLTAAGAVEVRAPRVNDKRVEAESGQRKRFRSVILPPWCRKSPKVAEVLPLLRCRGEREVRMQHVVVVGGGPPGCGSLRSWLLPQ
jgi:hypothetical protein